MFEIAQAFETAHPEETLGLFDIDMVLLHPKESAFQMANINRHKTVIKTLLKSLTKDEQNLTLNLIVKANMMRVDDAMPQILNNLKKKPNMNVIAFTASFAGKMDTITDMVLHRYQQLKAADIDFSDNFADLSPLVLNTLEPYRGHYPEFKHGILSSNTQSKGKVLIAFLKHIAASKNSPTTQSMPKTNITKPKTIIFVDDRKEIVMDVEQALGEHHPEIKFVGFVYDAASKFPSPKSMSLHL